MINLEPMILVPLVGNPAQASPAQGSCSCEGGYGCGGGGQCLCQPQHTGCGAGLQEVL